MLSGGIDSSLISLALSEHKLPHFTAQFKDPAFDETNKAKIVIDAVGAPWHKITGDTHENIEDDFRNVIWHLDGHLADPSALAFFRLCRNIRKHCKVAL